VGLRVVSNHPAENASRIHAGSFDGAIRRRDVSAMKMTKLRIAILTAVVAFPLGLLVAGPMRSHRNLLAAQSDLNQAWNHITASQKANEWDEGGHAEKAKMHIEQAKEEVRQAAEFDNHK
jgi:hypothetical protein